MLRYSIPQQIYSVEREETHHVEAGKYDLD